MRTYAVHRSRGVQRNSGRQAARCCMYFYRFSLPVPSTTLVTFDTFTLAFQLALEWLQARPHLLVGVEYTESYKPRSPLRKIPEYTVVTLNPGVADGVS